MQDHYSEIFQDIKRVLVIVAHPDDMEMIFSGTAARLKHDKKEVRLLVCTDGAPKEDSPQLNKVAETRKKEQLDSASLIGIPTNEVFILPNRDCSLTDTDERLVERIVFHMRSFRPDLIVTHQFEKVVEMIEPDFLWISHRDHRAVGRATMNAIMPMASSKNFFPEHFQQNLAPIEVYKVLIPNLVKGKVHIDINAFADVKRRSLQAHKSQMNGKYAEDIMDNHNIYLGQQKEPSYFESFRYYRFGYYPKRKEYEENLS
jgi:LmbE family N-acetylglucosaminyl deacetylase